MKKIFILFFYLLAITAIQAQKQTLSVYDLTCEYKNAPLGIDVPIPRLSWKIKSSLKDTSQEAYEFRIAENNASQYSFWKSDKVISGENVLIPLKGTTLKPNSIYKWQVRVWDKKGNVSPWSTPTTFETGMMGNVWKAKWIEPEKNNSIKESLPPVYTRSEFKIAKKVVKARYYVTSRGLYEIYLNGNKISDAVLTPGWTSYNNRLQYQTYDVTSLLKNGDNATAAVIGEGWYRGELAWGGNRNLYGQKLGLLAELHIWYSDGSVDIKGTDESWKANSDGPIIFSGIYDGEVYDARKEMQGWTSAGFNDKDWWNVSLSDKQQQLLVSQEGPMVKRIDSIKPIRIFTTPKGEKVVDMGQNMVGWIKLKVKGNKGDVIKLYHAEILDKTGNFYTENLRSAKQQIQYTLKGDGWESYEPHFTFQGFRFVKIEGINGDINPDQITGVVVHSEMKPTSSFETSSKEINQLQHNIIWGHKGNFVDVPTDCPQRDERLGWTGDAQAFVSTAAFNMDIATFFTKWMKDVAADQFQDGSVPFVIPDVLRDKGTSAGWGDVSVIAPWTIYLMYGDKRVLDQQYESMKKYVEYIRIKSGDSMIWKGGSVFGDWLYYH
ncbi:MAG: family 78 glycoside hydrolase catalytic domain, partial [Chitinophagaceae bacterium]